MMSGAMLVQATRGDAGNSIKMVPAVALAIIIIRGIIIGG